MILWIKMWKVWLPVLVLLCGIYTVKTHIDSKVAKAIRVIELEQKADIGEQYAEAAEEVVVSFDNNGTNRSEWLLNDFKSRNCEPSKTYVHPGLSGTETSTSITRQSGTNSSLGNQSGFSPQEIDFINREIK